ncbi:hypothetical protein [Thermoflexibacter ruber]|uniref:Uncharacterized protein n=1 Tax=Thermoflexibacter ruber TaxID=1003 RepID=A0A1I2D7F3_9BACT|nr:hypothetical protein [Thermoflexibacter ruber]SFE76434.1 hypothetical protein SAMN04488541_100699 [Thermoflexibacter ruber]
MENNEIKEVKKKEFSLSNKFFYGYLYFSIAGSIITAFLSFAYLHHHYWNRPKTAIEYTIFIGIACFLGLFFLPDLLKSIYKKVMNLFK